MTTRIVRPLDNPIDDLFTALDLLVRRDYRTGGYLCLSYRMRGCRDTYAGPRIVRESMGGYADMSVMSERVYYLTETLATRLELDGFTRGTPRWGYTDQSIRHVTEHGEHEYWRMRDELGAAMGALPKLFQTDRSTPDDVSTTEPVTEEANPPPKPRYDLQRRCMTRCQANDDGMCYDASVCPQLRDGEPARSGRHCPLDTQEEGD